MKLSDFTFKVVYFVYLEKNCMILVEGKKKEKNIFF